MKERQEEKKIEKYLYLTSKEYAVLLHLSGNRCVTGFGFDFPDDVQMKRQLIFDLYRKGIICNPGDRFEVAPEWKDVFQTVLQADRVLWISFRDHDKQDILCYIDRRAAVCMENLSDAGHDLYRVSMKGADAIKNELKENGMFPRIRMNKNDSKMLDTHLGVAPGGDPEKICSFSLYVNGESERKERVTLEKEQLIYFVRIENAEGTIRRRAFCDETERILDRYLNTVGGCDDSC
ncbi:MAG TPA: hypothetical protein DCG37_02475 [Lachnospiraceae bacterium]|nr:hypothetical protein [Lachnospiraceae bacterium]